VKVLFDHNVDRRLRKHLPGHSISTTREMRWEKLENGHLLNIAASALFDVVVTIDKKIEHQQNLKLLPLAVVVLDAVSSALPSLVVFAPFLLDLLKAPLDRALYVVNQDGVVLRLDAPR